MEIENNIPLPDAKSLEQQRQKVWREKNKDKLREQRKLRRSTQRENLRKWRANNPERNAAMNKKWREANPEKLRFSQIKIQYGISKDDWTSLFLKQGQRCAICRTSEPGKRQWHTDHCHNTKKVRGILCQHCNVGLGHFKNNPALLKLAAKYLGE